MNKCLNLDCFCAFHCKIIGERLLSQELLLHANTLFIKSHSETGLEELMEKIKSIVNKYLYHNKMSYFRLLLKIDLFLISFRNILSYRYFEDTEVNITKKFKKKSKMDMSRKFIILD